MSLGNILLDPHVGCLFIDFNDGGRLRINGRAEIVEQGPLLAPMSSCPTRGLAEYRGRQVRQCR